MERTVEHADDGKKGVHFIQGDGDERLAEMSYVHAGETRIIIDHTFVDKRLRGEGIGRMLLDATADMARAKGYTILATCPYAKAQLEKYPDAYADVT